MDNTVHETKMSNTYDTTRHVCNKYVENVLTLLRPGKTGNKMRFIMKLQD